MFLPGVLVTMAAAFTPPANTTAAFHDYVRVELTLVNEESIKPRATRRWPEVVLAICTESEDICIPVARTTKSGTSTKSVHGSPMPSKYLPKRIKIIQVQLGRSSSRAVNNAWEDEIDLSLLGPVRNVPSSLSSFTKAVASNGRGVTRKKLSSSTISLVSGRTGERCSEMSLLMNGDQIGKFTPSSCMEDTSLFDGADIVALTVTLHGMSWAKLPFGGRLLDESCNTLEEWDDIIDDASAESCIERDLCFSDRQTTIMRAALERAKLFARATSQDARADAVDAIDGILGSTPIDPLYREHFGDQEALCSEKISSNLRSYVVAARKSLRAKSTLGLLNNAVEMAEQQGVGSSKLATRVMHVHAVLLQTLLSQTQDAVTSGDREQVNKFAQADNPCKPCRSIAQTWLDRESLIEALDEEKSKTKQQTALQRSVFSIYEQAGDLLEFAKSIQAHDLADRFVALQKSCGNKLFSNNLTREDAASFEKSIAGLRKAVISRSESSVSAP